MKNILKKYKSVVVFCILLVGIILWFFWGYVYSGLQFIPPHFHANFAVYIDGTRVDFSADRFMEDVAGCSLTWEMYPEDRVHLHENNPDTIHIHDIWVSWGHFFSNIWIVFDSQFLSAGDGQVFEETQDKEITYILNGEKVRNPFNDPIRSEDRLLVSYGAESRAEIDKQYESISTNAGDFNGKYDPGSCGGTNQNGFIVLIQELFGHKH